MTRAGGARVVLVDDESWESLRELAGALRTRGVDVVRVAPDNVTERWSTRALDQLVFGRTLRHRVPLTAADPEARSLRA